MSKNKPNRLNIPRAADRKNKNAPIEPNKIKTGKKTIIEPKSLCLKVFCEDSFFASFDISITELFANPDSSFQTVSIFQNLQTQIFI